MPKKTTDFSNFSEKWDVVIIGSGIGGLMAGALLAKYSSKKVLVLEKHEKIGGCTHVYSRRKDYVFDVGVHFIGGVGENSEIRKILDHLLDRRLRWKAMPNHQDSVYIGEQTFNIISDRTEFSDYLKFKFPLEKKNIDEFFALVSETAKAFYEWQLSEVLPAGADWFFKNFLRHKKSELFLTAKQALDRCFSDPTIKALLACQWSALGVPIEQCSFGFFAAGFESYARGAWYPEGGGEKLAEEFSRVILSCGGEIRNNVVVDEILVEGKTARGVRVGGKGKEENIFAKQVISGAGSRNTYLNLLRKQKIKFRNDLEKSDMGISYVMMSLALDKNPLQLGINSANHWLFADEKFSSFFSEDSNLRFLNNIYVSSPSLKRNSEAHTIEVLILAPYKNFSSWRDSKWRKRPPEYKEYKNKILENCVDLIDARFPGIAESILFSEVSTPLTVQHFIEGSEGVLGIPSTPERLNYPWVRSRTPIKNLYLSGSDVFSWSVLGAMIGALKAYKISTEGSQWSLALDKMGPAS